MGTPARGQLWKKFYTSVVRSEAVNEPTIVEIRRKCIPYNKGSDSLRLYFLESEATAALLFHISLKHCLCHWRNSSCYSCWSGIRSIFLRMIIPPPNCRWRSNIHSLSLHLSRANWSQWTACLRKSARHKPAHSCIFALRHICFCVLPDQS